MSSIIAETGKDKNDAKYTPLNCDDTMERFT